MGRSSLYYVPLTGPEESGLHLAMERLEISLVPLDIRSSLALQTVLIGMPIAPMIPNVKESFTPPT